MNIAIFGLGYVGMAYAALLSKKHHLLLFDNSGEVIEKYLGKDFSSFDKKTEQMLLTNYSSLVFMDNLLFNISQIDFVIISTPTNYIYEQQKLDTSSIEMVMDLLVACKYEKPVIIKSTVSIGYCGFLRDRYKRENVYFSPEFLRENHAFDDVQKPSRLIISDKNKDTELFIDALMQCMDFSPPVLFVKSEEAETIKLFSNTYLAMRIAFFNELDTFAEKHQLNSRTIIEGMGYDLRIGSQYNHPSFGFGGYCLPKDSMQLDTLLGETEHPLISSINISNIERKKAITNSIISKHPRTIGVFQLVSKKNGSNIRDSVMVDVLLKLKEYNITIFIYEPIIKLEMYQGCVVVNNLDVFKKKSDLIIANFMDGRLNDVKDKVYTRDVFFNE